MLSGPNIEATRAMAQAVRVPVIASGGIANLEQVMALKAVEEDGITGAITGRAIYEGTLDFAQARALARPRCSPNASFPASTSTTGAW